MEGKHIDKMTPVVVWASRLSVIATGLAVPLLNNALRQMSSLTGISSTVGIWLLWSIALLCTLVPSSSALTAIRLALPTIFVIVAAAAVAIGISSGVAAALAISLLASLLIFSGDIGDSFVQLAAYGDERRAAIDMLRAQAWGPGVSPGESANTTHVTVADDKGNIVCSTQTINSLFGARFLVPGTGLIPNNYMALFDPRPGKALSVAPGKRITTSQAPLIALRDGKPVYALGMPGGLRIFGSVMQGFLNLVDHGMTLQEAVEAPRLWTQGAAVEVEPAFNATVLDALAKRGHQVAPMPHVGGGMNAIGFNADGSMEGAACWRADGTAIGLGGGLARQGVRFWPDRTRA